MRQLTALDALFLHLETPHTPSNGGVALLYDRTTAPGGEVTFQDVLDHFQERLHLLDALRMKLVRVPANLDRPYWVEDQNFDLEYHMRDIALPPPGDWRQLCLQISRLAARPLDLSRPVWELYMIDGLDAIDHLPKGSFALVLKVHHSALDGKAFLAIMDTLHSHDPTAQPPEPPPVTDRPVEPEPSPVDLLVRAGVNMVRAPMATTRALANVVPGMGRAALPALGRRLRPDERAGKRSTRTPETRFNAPVSPHRSYGGCFFDLADTKPIRRAVEGATVGDVVASVYGGALRTYLGEVGELPTEPMKAMLPVAVHDASDAVGMGNQLSAMIVSLATDVDDPVERLAAVRASTLAAKNTTTVIGPRHLTELLEILPEGMFAPVFRIATLASMRSRRGIGGVFNTMVSGMPGPREPLYLRGAKMIHQLGVGPVADGMGLINMHGSYIGELVLFFTADRQAMPDPDRYEECIYDAFHKLRAAV